MNIKKIIEYSLYLLVFFLPWQTRWIIRSGNINGGYFEYGTLSVYGSDILIIAVILLFVFYQFKKGNWKSEIVRSKQSREENWRLWSLIAGLELVIFVSIFYSIDKLVALEHYAWFLLGAGLFWLLINVGHSRFKLIFSFVLGASLSSALGVWQFLSQSSFAYKWLGFAAHNPADPGVSVVETLAGGRWLRAYGSLGHPNILGGVMVVGILALFYLLLIFYERKERKLEIRDWKFTIFLHSLLVIFYLLLLTSLFFSFSRSAWIGLIAGVLVLLLTAVFKKNFLAQKNILKLILAGSVLIFILSNVYSDLVLTRLSGNMRLEVKSNSERVASFRAAKEVIKNNWLLGVGIGNYTQYLHKINPGLKTYEYQPVHNVFLLVWSEIGALGLFFLIFLIFCLLLALIRGEGAYGISVIIAFVVMSGSDHWWWSLHFGQLLMWFVMGLAILSYRNNQKI